MPNTMSALLLTTTAGRLKIDPRRPIAVFNVFCCCGAAWGDWLDPGERGLGYIELSIMGELCSQELG